MCMTVPVKIIFFLSKFLSVKYGKGRMHVHVLCTVGNGYDLLAPHFPSFIYPIHINLFMYMYMYVYMYAYSQ